MTLLLLTLLGCSQLPEPPEPGDAPAQIQAPVATPTENTRSEEVRTDMADHFSAATTAAAAILRGELTPAIKALRTLSEQEPPADWPHGASPAALSVRVAARQGVSAGSLEEAGIALGLAVQSCGACHAELKAGPAHAPSGLEDMSADVRSHMARHLWAIDRLWDGLLMSRDADWALGLQVLAEEHPVGIAEVGKESKAFAATVHSLARDPGDAERGAVYGRIIASCGGCHQAFNVDFGSPPGDAPVPSDP
jgi:hypothetical protein